MKEHEPRRRSLPSSLNALLLLPTLLVSGVVAQEEPAAEPAPTPVELITDDLQVAKLIELSRQQDGARTHVEVLTGHFPRRLTGSPQLDLAQGWLIATLEDWGISARREAWGEVEVGFERGGSSGRVVAPEGRALTFATPAWSPGTLGPVEGPALREPATLEELEALREELAGAWVLRNPEVGRGERGRFNEFLEEAGAAGSLRPGTRDGRLVTTGSWSVDWEDLPKLVRVTLLHEEFQRLSDEVQAAADAGGEPPRLEFDIGNQFLHGPIPQHNVVADIPGSEWPEEFVIVQAHIDAWDGAQGACDNATGVATTLEAARLIRLAEIEPRRTIRFVFYSGEEQGLYGSRGYVDLHVDELERTSVVFNHDNGTRFLKGAGVTEAMLDDFRDVFAPARLLDPERPFEVREVPGLRPGPSDHGPFVEAGVPAIAWDQSNEGYRRLHHTQHDTLAEVIDGDQRHSSLVVAIAAVGFANLDHLVDRSFMREPDPRRMGVYLGGDEGRSLQSVVEGSRAEAAGWQAGDVILSIDGEEMEDRRHITRSLQQGGPKKAFVLQRGEETIESVLDYSDDPLEGERVAWRERIAEKAAEAREEAAAAESPAGEDADETVDGAERREADASTGG